MRYCKSCGVRVAGRREHCPLCQGPLEGRLEEDDREIFPLVPTLYQQYSLFLRVLLFLSIAAGTICLLLNFSLLGGSWWSLTVLMGLGMMWVVILTAIRRRGNLSKAIVTLAVVISLLLVLLDWRLGWRGWSVNYAIPVLMIFGTLGILVLSKLLGRKVSDYGIHLLVNGVFGLIPLVFVLLGWATVVLPSLVSVGVSVLSISALLLFSSRDAVAELKRRLHL